MIQKRYEYWSNQGKTWSDWFNYDENNNNLTALQTNEQFQLGKKLRNEFRII